MARSIFVTTLPFDWVTDVTSYEDRVELLVQRCALPIEGSALHVILAPEYMFRRSPAQVVSKQADTRIGDAHRTNALPLEHYASSKKKTSTIFSSKKRESLRQRLRSATKGREILIVPGSIFWQHKYAFSRGAVQNSCDVIYKGKVIHEYGKQVDSLELDSFEKGKNTFSPGRTRGIFEVDGLQVGVEICADHTSDTNLRSTLIEINNPDEPDTERTIRNQLNVLDRYQKPGMAAEFGLDLHLLISDGMPFVRTSAAIRNGGFAVHCDTRIAHAIYQRQDPPDYKGMANALSHPRVHEAAHFDRQQITLPTPEEAASSSLPVRSSGATVLDEVASSSAPSWDGD